MKKLSYISLLSLLAVVYGCQSDENELISNDRPIEIEREGVNGTVLASINLSKGHTVDFIEFESGMVAIMEDGLMDMSYQPLDLKSIVSANNNSLVNTYLSLADKDINSYYIKELESAELRSKNYLQQKSLWTDAELVDAGKRLKASAANARVAAFDRSNCSADLLGDNFSAQWFIDNLGPGTDTETNANEAGSMNVTSEIMYIGAAADYNVGAEFNIFRSNSNLTGWNDILISSLAPRTYRIFMVFNAGTDLTYAEVIGLSPCSRVHYMNKENFQ